MIYFDNAATTAMSNVALYALTEVSSNQYGNPSAVYGIGRKTKEILEEARKIIADCIGADSDEIFFTSCGTESDNWVIRQMGMKLGKIVTSAIEHHAVLLPAEGCKEEGAKLTILPVNAKCIVTANSLTQALDGTPELVSIMMQNNETGALQDIRELAEIVHTRNSQSVFHTDAVQAVGHTTINVHELGIDMLSASAHKFNGPKGIGFLYIKKSIQIKPFVLGGGQETGLRAGTENVAGIYSMAKALQENVDEMFKNQNQIKELEKLFLTSLNNEHIEFIINADSNRRASGILNIAIKGIDGEGLLNMLDMHDICISIGSACNSKSKNRSHVLNAMGLTDERIDESVRISIGRYNTKEDIVMLVKWIKKYYEMAEWLR